MRTHVHINSQWLTLTVKIPHIPAQMYVIGLFLPYRTARTSPDTVRGSADSTSRAETPVYVSMYFWETVPFSL